VARVLSTAFCVALLAASAGAFALTQGAKTELVPVFGMHVDRVFSPDCNCPTDVASIDFRLRKPERLTVWIDRQGRHVRMLVPGRTYERGPVSLEFDGVDDRGLTLPEGVYRPVVRLGGEHRTIELPNRIVLDTQPPVVHSRHRIYTHISPDGDGRNDSFRIAYSAGEPSRGILIVDGRQVAVARRKARHGVLVWNGRIGGRVARPGNHVLDISARDAAGNRAKPFPFAVVAIRYVKLGRTRIFARPGGRFSLLALSDATQVDWFLHGRRGAARPGTLHLRAPSAPGVYHLYVIVGRHAAGASVVVG
jgi:hypothetical protein